MYFGCNWFNSRTKNTIRNSCLVTLRFRLKAAKTFNLFMFKLGFISFFTGPYPFLFRIVSTVTLYDNLSLSLFACSIDCTDNLHCKQQFYTTKQKRSTGFKCGDQVIRVASHSPSTTDLIWAIFGQPLLDALLVNWRDTPPSYCKMSSSLSCGVNLSTSCDARSLDTLLSSSLL